MMKRAMRNIENLLGRRKIMGIAGMIAICGMFLLSCGKEEKQAPAKPVVRPVKLMSLSSAGAMEKFTFPGMVRASQRVDLAFQVSGTLVELPIREGQNVKKGDLIARIDPQDFKTNLRKAEGQLAKAKAALDRARSDYERIIRIQKEDPGAASQSMVDRRRAAVDAAKAEVESLKAAVKGARDKLSYTYLRAPFSGIIARRYVDNFQEVRAKQPIVSLQDIFHIEILIDLPEMLMAKIKKGTSLSFAEFASAPGKKYELSKKEIATQADSKTQTYRVVLLMKAPEGVRILPGMTANVTLYTLLGKGTGEQFVIPAVAVFADDAGNSNVWVVDEKTMTVHKQKVTTGELTGTDSIRILSGLRSGQKIAVTGVDQLREGMKVRDMAELDEYKRGQ